MPRTAMDFSPMRMSDLVAPSPLRPSHFKAPPSPFAARRPSIKLGSRPAPPRSLLVQVTPEQSADSSGADSNPPTPPRSMALAKTPSRPVADRMRASPTLQQQADRCAV